VARSYHEYFKNLENFTKNYHEIAEINEIKIVGADEWGHKVMGIREAMKVVNSEYLLMLEHDIPLTRDFKIDDVLEDLDLDETIKHVHFKLGGMEPDSGEIIWPWYDGHNDIFGKEKRCKHYTYTRTPDWSEQPHVCRTSYYTDYVLPKCPNASRRPIEYNVIWSKGSLRSKLSDKATQERYGLSWVPSDILTRLGFSGQDRKRGRYWWSGVKGSALEKVHENQGTYLFGSLERLLTGVSFYGLHHAYSDLHHGKLSTSGNYENNAALAS
jgi:hypothetical protein